MRILLTLTLLGIGRLHAVEAPDFTREVRPILSQYCFKCHGPDDKTRKGELRLDIQEEALKPAESGAAAIVPGKAEASELVARILTDDEEKVMPPPSTKKALTAVKKDILKRWIAAGAEYKQHWAFVAPKRPAVPSVGKARVQNPIDAFIAEKLAAEGLAQSPEADAESLCRRLHFDLIGLPPTGADLAAFVAEVEKDRRQAIERLVDRLLASPQYGERWARKWLDLARYADTNGYEKDRDRSMWPYRDWVINALNADMPFDQFTIEQLAGDLLPNATVQQRIATGFHRNTMLNEEGGIDPLEFRFHAMTDRVATTGTTWLGLTTGCAQCHTHKYDPITHREYYQLFAFLNNADEPEIDLPPADAARTDAERERKITALLAELPKKWPVKEGENVDGVVEARFQEWLSNARKDAVEWQTLRPVRATSNLPLLTVERDDAVFVSGDISKSDIYQLRFEKVPKAITAIRLEALPDDRLPAHGPGMAYYEGPKGDFFMGEFEISANGKPVKFARATESYSKNNFGNNPATAALATDGDPQTGWSCAQRFGEAHEAVFVPAEPIKGGQFDLKMIFGRHYPSSLGRFRISVTTRDGGANARGWPSELGRLLLIPDAEMTPKSLAVLREHFLLNAPELEASTKAIRALRKPPKGPTTLVMRERPAENPRPTFIHNRGEFLQPTERVEPGVLSVLNPLPADAPRNRLGFARWLVAREHPLTARVVVNRAWAAFFGRGLVKTADDFGFQGEAPSHPELLDWVAVDFMENGWSQKKMHRQIVLSATYQQSSRITPELIARDPENRLLARFPRVRLEAEMVRDAALRGSGLLTLKVGGPSVRPPQPEGVTEVAYGSPKWQADSGDNRYRRSLYTFAKRTAPFALYNAFDAPTGEACVARRDVSNTPLQALTLLNDQVFMEAAQALAAEVVEQRIEDGDRVRMIYWRLLSREPAEEEAEDLLRFFEQQKTRFANGELDPAKMTGTKKPGTAEQAAWTVVVRALLNLDEVVTKG
jgi:hypothetical protein